MSSDMSSDIRLDSFYLGDALANHLFGSHGPETLIRDAQSMLERMWGKDRPVLLVPPSAELGTYPRVCLAWLTGPAREEKEFGTHLFVIWFRDGDPSHPLQEALTHVEQHGGWKTLAKVYEP